MSPGAITSVPFTLPAFGNPRQRPPGQCDRVPGFSVYPQTPPTRAPSMRISSLLPAGEVTFIILAARSRRIPSLTLCSSSGEGARRSRTSGCSFEMYRTRVPPFRTCGSSAACIRPSRVQSATNTEPASAATAGARFCRATEAPVERIGTGALWRDVGTITWKGRAPRRTRASSAS